jgi:predicted nucleotide-binding protein
MPTKKKARRSRNRPALFVGSSVEGLDVAYAIQENLQHDAEVTVWPQGVFELSDTAMKSLVSALTRSAFGIFVFTPDDRVWLRGTAYAAVRDNVIFELGLFTGKLGADRSFIVVAENTNIRIPTDLTGVTPGKYDAKRKRWQSPGRTRAFL